MTSDPALPPDRPEPRRIATKTDFARELTLAKDRAGVTVREIAAAVGAPASTVGGYLSGKHLPALRPADQFPRILAACGVTDQAQVHLWWQALRRARRAGGDQTSPTSPAGPPVPPPDTAAARPDGRRVLVSTRPPVDRLTRGPEVRGRHEVTERLRRDLDALAGQRAALAADVLVLCGLGGSGKSTVALLAARMAAERGIPAWWVSGQDPDTVMAGMQALSAELGADPDQIKAGSPPDLVWRLLEAYPGPWLLVLDNADDPPGTLALPGAAVGDGNGWMRSVRTGRGLVLVTTRDGSVGTWGDPPPPWLELIPVRPLDAADAARVLTDLAGPGAGTEEQARDLAARLGGLPLALCLAGRHVAEVAAIPAAFAGPRAARTFAGYDRALDEGRHAEVLARTGPPGDGPAGDAVGRTWELSLDLLAGRGQPTARPLLRLLSCLGPAPVPSGLLLRPATLSLSPLFGPVSGREVWETLRALAGLGIVEPAGPGPTDVVVVHQLVRDMSRRAPDVRDRIGEHLALVTELVAGAATELDPRDPATWEQWRSLVDHTFSPLDLVLGFGISPRAVPPGVLTAATLAARYLRASGQPARAEAAYARLVRLGIAALGEHDPRVLEVQHDLSRVWYDLGRLGDASRGLRAVLRARTQTLGPAHPDTLTTQHYLGRALRDAGQLDAAWRLFRKTLDARRAVLGEDHPDTLTSRNNAADALRALGRHEQAGRELASVLAARTRLLGAEHPATLVTRYHLARLAHDRDDLAGARAALEALVDDYLRVLGPEHPRTLLSRQALIEVRHDLGEREQALAEARELLAQRRGLLGDRHPAVLVTRHRIGLLLVDLGAYAAAEAELAEVLAARRLVLGPRHPETALARASLSAVRARHR
ncbi:tetratricopeptide repeat protein [Catellatospora bangladeshensis]|uniref:ATP/GTP-binding protein n=1 Tax=Catellatospora bangladeshensis TaxID=310355 RepID=A0A8J3NMD9_9ACTN|nr:tetratricopeptide repeat protein [Catellatospora bangladeshensis]GIF85121.1 ATP/GTP-binding protein [Catellatospora bangladeshensis]